ncbi:hypothetical protein Taro_029862 [Colocasia esculenta]|uniref:Retrotransposon gag domain-containing protein n=1 Tax=Colocasia esculenta TaxID=4460 RepID=A0A843VMG6_COLES|nr:hypothetical protein [Colocasia esculenta]
MAGDAGKRSGCGDRVEACATQEARGSRSWGLDFWKFRLQGREFRSIQATAQEDDPEVCATETTQSNQEDPISWFVMGLSGVQKAFGESRSRVEFSTGERHSLNIDLAQPINEIERFFHKMANQDQNQVARNVEEVTPRQMKEYFIPSNYQSATCIRPEIPANHFEIKPGTIQMLTSFYGNPNEDPYKHIDEFLQISSTVKIQNFTENALRLTLFPFSLKDKAKHWLGTIGRTIRTWPEMQQEFLKKFYPIGRTNTMRRAITGFSQHPGELMHESWERLKGLLRKCPHHGLSRWQIVQAFYEGLIESNRKMVDASCGGAFMTKSEDEAYNMFDTLSENSINHASLHSYERALGPVRKAGLYELRERGESDSRVEDLLARLDQRLEQKLEQKFDQLLSLTGQATSKFSQPPETCAINLVKPNTKIYKAKAKTFHDKHIHRKNFQVHDKVWLYSRLRLFPGKLKSRWDGPYTVVKVCDNGVVIILDPKTGQSFTINGQRLNYFFESPHFLKIESTKLAEPNGA